MVERVCGGGEYARDRGRGSGGHQAFLGISHATVTSGKRQPKQIGAGQENFRTETQWSESLIRGMFAI